MGGVPIDEVKRKGFHLLSLIYVIGYLWFPVGAILWALGITILIVGILEIIRFSIPACNQFFCENFKGFYRPEEATKVSGLLGTLSGAFLAILIFDLIFQQKAMVFASFLYLSFGDAVAALVGRSIGKHKMSSGKSWEGSAACFIACLICGLFIFNWKFALAGAFIATAVEAIPWRINDNFWMQIINAGLLTALSLIPFFHPVVTAAILK